MANSKSINQAATKESYLSLANKNELKELVYLDQSPYGCNIKENCKYGERSLSYALGVNIPTPGLPPEELFKECCYTHIVLADLNSSNDLRNDYSSFYHQRQTPNETVDFVLHHFQTGNDIDLINDDYGKFFDFGHFDSNQNLKGYLIEWKKVLADIGPGTFKIIKKINIVGIEVEFQSIVFTLMEYSTSMANGTIRIDAVMDGFMEKENIIFKGTGWKHSIRVPGFFGNREPQLEQDNLVDRSYRKNQISSKQTNEYKFQTNLVPDCITNEIFDFFLLSDNLKITDYNLNNHSYNYKKFPVNYDQNEGTVYGSHTRKAKLNLIFSDKVINQINRS